MEKFINRFDNIYLPKENAVAAVVEGFVTSKGLVLNKNDHGQYGNLSIAISGRDKTFEYIRKCLKVNADQPVSEDKQYLSVIVNEKDIEYVGNNIKPNSRVQCFVIIKPSKDGRYLNGHMVSCKRLDKEG